MAGIIILLTLRFFFYNQGVKLIVKEETEGK